MAKEVKQETLQNPSLPQEWRTLNDHPIYQVIGDISQAITTRSNLRNICHYAAFVSQIEPKTINDAILDENSINAMHEELNQFERNEVWDLVPRINGLWIKWVFRNKLDKSGVITRNKARLVTKGYNQEECIDYDETFAPVARLKAIRLLLAYASIMNIKLYQMDVKITFLNGYIQEEWYVDQLLGFENHV